MQIKEIIQRAMEIKKKYAVLEKKKYGKAWDNSQIMQGLVVDIGELMEIVMAKEGAREMKNIDERLSHELIDCFWSILVLSEKYGIDIEKHFLKTMDKLEEHIKDKC